MQDSHLSLEAQIAALKRALEENERHLKKIRDAAAAIDQVRITSEKKHELYRMMTRLKQKQEERRSGDTSFKSKPSS